MQESKLFSERKERAKKIARELRRLFPRAHIALKYGTAWELLVAVVLSAQCTDKKVNEVTAGLFKKYPAFEDYVNASREEFEQDIKPEYLQALNEAYARFVQVMKQHTTVVVFQPEELEGVDEEDVEAAEREREVMEPIWKKIQWLYGQSDHSRFQKRLLRH